MSKKNDSKKKQDKNENADQIFVEGIRAFEPHQNAPSFVKANIIISLNELIAFAKESPELLSEYEGKKQLKIQLLESKQGNLYFVVDTFKPEPKAGKKQTAANIKEPIEDLPF